MISMKTCPDGHLCLSFCCVLVLGCISRHLSKLCKNKQSLPAVNREKMQSDLLDFKACFNKLINKYILFPFLGSTKWAMLCIDCTCFGRELMFFSLSFFPRQQIRAGWILLMLLNATNIHFHVPGEPWQRDGAKHKTHRAFCFSSKRIFVPFPFPGALLLL